MGHLKEIFSTELFNEMVSKKYVNVRKHPKHNLFIANYSQGATWDGVWNDVTLNCRGLVYDEDFNVVARPFKKFFNHNQPGAPSWTPDMHVVSFDKVDGSLGILYPLPDGSYGVATRGSFDSEQALWATSLWNEKYAGEVEVDDRYTYCFEIIAPFNRIVLDYGSVEDLVFLSAVDKSSGLSVFDVPWDGLRSEILFEGSLIDALSLPDREDAEGMVLLDPVSGERLKLKQKDYLKLHKLFTNTTTKHVWEVLSSGVDYTSHFADTPDEFISWVEQEALQLQNSFDALKGSIVSEFDSLVASLPLNASRAQAAKVFSASSNRSFMFMLYDSNSIDEMVWRLLKPEGGGRTLSINFSPVSSSARSVSF